MTETCSVAKTRTSRARFLRYVLLSLLVLKLAGCSTKQVIPLPDRTPPLPTDVEKADYSQLPDRPGVFYCDRLVGWAFPNEAAEVRAEDKESDDAED